jgi:hypothetical protein
MKIRFSVLVPSLVALVIVAACGPSSVATVSPTPSPPAVFDDGFGFLVGNTVRKESDPKPLFTLNTGDAALIVSPDGRHVAYEVKNEVRVMDIAPNAVPRTLLTTTGKEIGFQIAWSTDSTGLVVGAAGPYPNPPAQEVPPTYVAIRVVDIAGGAAREVARISNASVVPLAWDRQAHLITAYEPTSMGAGRYDLIDESGKLKRTTATPGLYVVESSKDGQHVLGRGDPNTAIRVWPSDSFERGVVLVSTAGEEHLATASWRPGTSEVGVLFHGDRLELWDANGARRTIPLPAAPETSDRYASLTFRLDGKAVVVSRMSGDEFNPKTYAVAVDLSSGRTAVVDWAGVRGAPAVSVRIG